MINFKKMCNVVKVLALLGFVVALAGCPQATVKIPTPAESAGLVGTWVSSSGDSYEINATTLTYKFGSDLNYKGSIVDITSYGTHGYITIEITQLGTSPYITPQTVGKYYTTHFEKLTASSVDLSGAYNASGKAETDTLAEAKAEFTKDNGYFDYHGSYTK